MTRNHRILIVIALATSGCDFAGPEAQSVREIERLGGTVKRDATLPNHPVTTVALGFSRFRNKDTYLLKDLNNLAELDLSCTGVTDVGLKQLKELKNLTQLGLSNNQITDAGLKQLSDLTNLT